MAQWGYSGLIQFYIMAELCGMIALSILEMFYYRLQVTVLHQKLPVYIKLSKFRVWLFRFSLVLIPVIATITFSPAIISQEEAAMDTWKGSIHGIFIFIPVFFQFYALFFQLTSNDFAFVMLLSFAYHGFLSTCAMIIFTKPLRIRMFFCSRWTSKTEQQTQLPSLTKAITNI
uniref:Serpentine Receptor, class H n=1 Tax=Caenorhabditis tropicalis TaxID=1561998 RepID=A0A1I7TRG7_9PELO